MPFSIMTPARRKRRGAGRNARRDPSATCTIRFYVGAGVPGEAGRYQELPVSFDRRAFQDHVERMVSKVFPNATFLKTRGVWKGGSEDGLMVEILASPVRGSCTKVAGRARTVARKIAKSLGQEAVLLTVTDAEGRSRKDLVEGIAA